MFLSCLQEERLPWNQPWVMDVPGFGAHHNPITGTRYRGMNATILWAMGLEHQYPDPRWCTFKQAQNKDWHIKKGEKGTPIEFWCIYDTRERKKLTLHEADEIVRQNPDREEDMRPCSSVYVVFNGTQIDGIPELPQARHVAPEYTNVLLENFAGTYLSNEGIALIEGSNAAYNFAEDIIKMPPKRSFVSELDYYDTLFHDGAQELTPAVLALQVLLRKTFENSGAENRLDRGLQTKDKEEYAIEELRAEMAGAFLLSAAGAQVPESVSQNNQAYIQSWAEDIKDAPNTLFQAIKDAGTICDFVSARGELERLKSELAAPAMSVSHRHYIPEIEIEL